MGDVTKPERNAKIIEHMEAWTARQTKKSARAYVRKIESELKSWGC